MKNGESVGGLPPRFEPKAKSTRALFYKESTENAIGSNRRRGRRWRTGTARPQPPNPNPQTPNPKP